MPPRGLLALLFAPCLALAARAQVRPDAVLLRTPDVSADTISFRYDGDVWLVDKHGGEARRLSSSPGNEGFPRFSPDGTRIAFMGGYQGGSDLYVLGLEGGVPERLTHHPENEMLCDWLPDGSGLLFFSSATSGQRRAPKLFTVPAAGGQPSELPVPFGAFGSIDSTGEWLAYTPYLHSEFSTWRRYQGGNAQDIWLFNLKTKASRRVTDYAGDDALPMWNGDELLFVSDRGPAGRLNLWAYDLDGDAFEQRTHFTEFDVRFPSIGPADVVFENGGKLWRHELAGGANVQVDVVIPSDRPRLAPASHDLQELVAGAGLGPTAKRVVIEARGELFSVPAEEGVVRNLTGTDGVAERDPAWSPDGRWIAHVSDRSGEYELTVRRADGRPFRWQGGVEDVHEQRLTDIGPGWKSSPSWAPDSKSLVFGTNDGGLHRLVLESGELTRLDTSPEGEPFDVDWSPDSRWLAYSHRHSASNLPALYLFDLEAGERHEVTSGLFADQDPSFDRSGDWLYFTSSREFAPIYEDLGDTWIYANTQRLLAVPLRADVENPFLPWSDEEEIEEDEEGDEGAEATEAPDADADALNGADHDADEAEAGEEPKAGAGAKEDEDAEEDAVEPVEIDLEGFEGRAIALPVPAGNLGSVAGGTHKVFFVRGPRTGSEGGKPALMSFDMKAERKERKEQTILEGVRGFGLARRAEKALVALEGPSFAVIGLTPGQKADQRIDLSGLVATIDPRAEWQQVVTDAGRIMRDFFYDPTMHGVDWEAEVARYAAAARDATSRDDVHYLIGELIAQLNVGHAYNSGPPSGLQSAGRARSVGLLGCDWTLEQGAYRIARILRGELAETDGRGPLSEPGCDAAEGDWLLAVNGVAVDTSRDLYAAFEGLAGKRAELTLNAAPTLDGAERRVVVELMGSERALRYRDWIRRKRAEVERLSDGRVGYVHVPDTGVNGQNELVRQFMGQMHKDALLVDERWNGGGQIPTRFLELLDRPARNHWALRHGEDWTWPPVAHFGPKAMLINYASGSGGDCFPYYFRQYGLGKLIGTRTWGGLVGLSGNPAMIDGSRVSVPRFAFYEVDGTWGVEGYGVQPDIEVIEDPADMQGGRDPQLIAGVEVLLRELETGAYVPPARPDYADRSGVGIKPEDR